MSMLQPGATALNLEALVAEPVDWRFKSFPVSAAAVAIRDVGAMGWHALDGDFGMPLLVIRESALDHNIKLMARYCDRHKVSLAPHAKTPVSPQLVDRQLAAGAWGISVANLHQARLLRLAGCRRILMANEVVERATLEWLAAELGRDPTFEFISLVDSPYVVRLMDEQLAAAGLQGRTSVLVEMGVPGGRCGCRTLEEALGVAGAIGDSRHLQLTGVEVYEGMVPRSDLDVRLRSVDELLALVRAVMVELDRRRWFAAVPELIVTAGGSLFFDRVVDGLGSAWRLSTPVRCVLRSGSYITHDAGEYDRLSPLAGRAGADGKLRQALELWAHVLSIPEPGLAVIGFGRRDAAHDQELPVPFARRVGVRTEPVATSDLEVFALNDQHARARIRPDLQLEPGDLLGFHVSHPCTTFDNWGLVPLVNDGYLVLEAIRSYL